MGGAASISSLQRIYGGDGMNRRCRCGEPATWVTSWTDERDPFENATYECDRHKRLDSQRLRQFVYLAGGINGCTDDEAVAWREYVKDILGEANCLDPMRRDYRGREDAAYQEIVEGDIADIDGSWIIIANCWQKSWGTPMEIFYAARDCGIPVLAVVPMDASISPWLRYHTTLCYSLDEAIARVRAYG